MIYRQIYQAFLGHCSPYEADEPWSRLQANVDLWKSPSDAMEVMDSLVDNYSEEDLLASRLAIKGKQGWLVLNPILTGPLNLIVPLRPQPNEPPIDLLVQDGTLSRRLPVCAALQDGSLRNAIEKTGALLVVFSMEDLAVLRLAGIPATTATGLTNLASKRLDEFCKSYGLRESLSPAAPGPAAVATDEAEVESVSPTGTSADQEAVSPSPSAIAGDAYSPPCQPVRLVFVNWTPSTLECESPQAVDHLRSRFRQLERYLGLPLDDMFLWTPTKGNIERVTFCLAKATCEDVQAGFLESMDERRVEITSTEEIFARPKDLIEAIGRLREVLLHRTGNRKLKRHVLAEYAAMLETELITPLIQQALETMDPIQRSRLLAIANMNRIVHPATEVYSAAFAQRIAKSGVRKAGSIMTTELSHCSSSMGFS